MTQTTHILLKPTHIPWIEKIPETWESLPIRWLFYESNIRSTSGTETLLSVSQYTWVTKRGDNLDLEVDNLTNAETLEWYKIVSKDDLVINIMLAWNGSLAVSDFDWITSPAYSIFKAKSECYPKYYHYLFRADILQSEFKRYSTGIIDSRLRLYPDVFLRLPIIKPPLSVQIAIVNFIDQKTEKISTLISNKKKLINLLKEQKQSIIHRAVTKGIDENIKMKDSGVAWVGEIPEDWEVKRLKYCVFGKLEYGANEPAESNNPDNPRYIRITDFWNDTFCSLTMEQAKNYLLQEWDILFARSGATVWKTFMFTDYNWTACFAWYLIRARANTKIINEKFLYLYTKSSAYEEWKSFIFNESTIQNIWADKYNNLPVPIPSLVVQSAIIKYIEKETAQIDNAIAKIEKEITFIEEYRTSLIYQAVTGKITIS